MKALAILAALALVGCDEPTPNTARWHKSNNPSFNVKELFTHDGCTVYRFDDGGRNVYFTRCRAATTQTMWHQGCGKACTYPMLMPTIVED